MPRLPVQRVWQSVRGKSSRLPAYDQVMAGDEGDVL